MSRKQAPRRPPETADGGLVAVALDIELEPIDRKALPTQVIQVLPVGTAQIKDSRESFEVPLLSVATILYHFGELHDDLMVDYNHGAYMSDEPADARAAGWIESLWAVVPPEWEDMLSPLLEPFGKRAFVLGADDESGHGIWAFVRWTDEAAELIRNREYRYISPVIFFSYTGIPEYLWNVAITNMPAIDGMKPLAASLLAGGSLVDRLVASADTSDDDHPLVSLGLWVPPFAHNPESFGNGAAEEPSSSTPTNESTGQRPEKGDVEMDELRKLAESYGLTVAAEDDVGDVLRAYFDELAKRATELEAENGELSDKVASLADELEAANGRIQELEDKLKDVEIKRQEAEVENAIAAGKLHKSQREWAVAHYEAFAALLPSLEETPMGPPQGQRVRATANSTDDLPTDDRTVERDAVRAFMKEHGITDFGDAYIKFKAAQGNA